MRPEVNGDAATWEYVALYSLGDEPTRPKCFDRLTTTASDER